MSLANRILSLKIQKDDDDDRRKKMFLVKKHADMHGNCIWGRKGATQEREVRVHGRGREDKAWIVKEGERERESTKEGRYSLRASLCYFSMEDETTCMLAR